MSALPRSDTSQTGSPAETADLRDMVGRVTWASLTPNGSLFRVISFKDEASGKTIRAIGRMSELTVGRRYRLRMRVTQLPHTRTPNYSIVETPGYGMIDEPAQALEGPKDDAEPTIRLQPLEVTRLPIDRAAMKSYFVKHFAEIGGTSAETVLSRMAGESPEDLLDALDELSEEQFAAQSGLSAVKAKVMLNAWREDPARHRAMIVLASMGLNDSQSRRTLERAQAYEQRRGRALGEDDPRFDALRAVRRICAFPYRLSMIDGIGFGTADRAALALGIGAGSDQRIVAAAREMINLSGQEGHTMLPLWSLSDRVAEALSGASAGGRSQRRLKVDAVAKIEPERVAKVIWSIDASEGLVFPLGKKSASDPVSLEKYMRAEKTIAQDVMRLMTSQPRIALPVPDAEALNAMMGLTLHPRQVDAVRKALSNPFTILTGGPGSGKSTITKAILRVAAEANARIVVMAPTGRAARRASEVTGYAASTLHRALGSQGFGRGFQRHRDNPLDADLIAVDESSMNDAQMTAALLEAVSSGSRLLMIGDHDQLPSVGPGAALADLINSGIPPVARLTKTQRQGAGNPIIDFARNIRDGVAAMPEDDGKHLLIRPSSDKERIAKMVIAEYLNQIEEGIPPEEIVILTAMNKGVCGVDAMNLRIQQSLNPEGARRGLAIRPMESSSSPCRAGPGDRVMQRINDADLVLANGDVGTILRIDDRRKTMIVDFGLGEVEISGDRKLKNLTLAYACTIHKSQGSEYRSVLMTLSPEHTHFMRRNLIYTGVTRSKDRLHLCGDPDVVIRGINNTADSQRRTLLPGFLRAAHKEFQEIIVPDVDNVIHAPLPEFDMGGL